MTYRTTLGMGFVSANLGANVLRAGALLAVAAGLAACGAGDGSEDSLGEPVGETSEAVTIGPAGHALDYYQCATEGGSCAVHSKYVAYGANGSFKFRSSFSFSPIPCNAATFGGDPAPGFAKACYASSYSPTGLSEGSSGNAGGSPVNIAYGANGVFNFLTISGAYTCNNATFGDPIPGPVKACYAAPSSYTFDAWEGGTMNGLFNTPVAYGANGKFVFAVLTGSAGCSNGFFGSDPAVGITKACYVMSRPRIADEWQHFNSGGPHVIYYGSGLNGNFITGSPRVDAPTQASGDCTNATFGGDPDIGVGKHCYAPNVSGANSCAGACGGQSAGGCWCDSACMSFGDCCADFTQQNCF